jgi:hypothetical protein
LLFVTADLLAAGFFGGFFSMMLYHRSESVVEFFLAFAVSRLLLAGACAIAERITEDALLDQGVELTVTVFRLADGPRRW